jgi:hypothetical protein
MLDQQTLCTSRQGDLQGRKIKGRAHMINRRADILVVANTFDEILWRLHLAPGDVNYRYKWKEVALKHADSLVHAGKVGG